MRGWITSTEGESSPNVLVIRSSVAMATNLNRPDRRGDVLEVGAAGGLGPPLDLRQAALVRARDPLDRFTPERQPQRHLVTAHEGEDDLGRPYGVTFLTAMASRHIRPHGGEQVTVRLRHLRSEERR